LRVIKLTLLLLLLLQLLVCYCVDLTLSAVATAAVTCVLLRRSHPFCCWYCCSYLCVVKLTLLGSIISNLLLVLGSGFIAGGVLHPMQHLNQQGINANCGLLMLAGEPLLIVGICM
jgi:Ca2+/H+ antiporter